MKKIVIISGPTASGKSALALQIKDLHDIAIINSDALQIYEGLPVLSAQPSEAEKKSAPHFLYSHFAFNQSCSVVMWLELVKSRVEELWSQNKLPLIVGGSGMYISKLIDGISEIPEIEKITRIQIQDIYESSSQNDFIKYLVSIGEDENRIKNLDKQRLIRAGEVLLQTKKSIFWWQNQKPKKFFSDDNFLHVNLNPNRDNLYQNCNSRFLQMLKVGAIEEVQSLLNQGVREDMQIAKTLGFLEIKSFLEKEISYEKLIEIVTQKTRNYAKRQLTWFRHQFAQAQIRKEIFEDLKSAENFLRNYHEI